jgi:PAS domain S-box-containing protein
MPSNRFAFPANLGALDVDDESRKAHPDSVVGAILQAAKLLCGQSISLEQLTAPGFQPPGFDHRNRPMLAALATAASRALAGRASMRGQQRIALDLADAEDRLRNIIEATRAGTWERNLQTGEQRINARWAEQLGYTLDELQPVSVETWRRLAHPEDFARAERQAERQQNGEAGLFESEVRLRHRDGRWVWVLSRGQVMSWTVDGQPEWMFGTHLDITDRVNQRIALEMLNQRVRLATDSGGIGIWECDFARELIHCDDWIFRLYGLLPVSGPITVAQWYRLIHPEDLPGLRAALESARVGPADLDTEFRVIWPDGTVRHLRSSGRATRDAQGRALTMTGANWDVSEARRLAARLSAEHELLRVTLAAITDGVITTDAQTCVQWMNPVAERLTGWSCAAAAGRALGEIYRSVDGGTRRAGPDTVIACLAGEAVAPRNRLTLLLSRDGAEHAIDERATPIRDGAGSVTGAVLVFRDVTVYQSAPGVR